ncbi:MAG: glycosyltransferase family 2 protein [Bacteroidaceae bacterium]|nr:glycosyltransferase family 2 protein [Bacteroidaceae bacterium]
MNRYCVIIPTYNNGGTVADVARRALDVCSSVYVVDDGSTDNTLTTLEGLGVKVLKHNKNKGKGRALKTGFKAAMADGFTHAVTIDADGQHYPEDIPLLMQTSNAYPGDFIIGLRNLTSENMPRENTAANRFSNFWFHLQTGQVLADTQSGFRIYPLDRLYGLGLVTSRYESELELMVFAAWHGVKMNGKPVRVWYAPEGERVSHFRPFRDFFRISVLNAVLCFGALFVGLPLALWRRMDR